MLQRDGILDILKGIGILLVIFAHVNNGFVRGVVYLFHMPLFFFLSGAAMNYSKSINFNILKRLRTLIVPYLFFSLLCFVYWRFIELEFRPIHNSSILPGVLSTFDWRLQQFFNIFLSISVKDAYLYNIALWFLPCLFTTMMLYIGCEKLLRKFSVLGVIALAATSFLFQWKSLPWCFEIALVALPYMYAGRLTYTKLKSSQIYVGGAFLAFSILLIYFTHPHVDVDMRTHQTGEWWCFYAVAISIIAWLVICIRYIANWEYGIFQWLGRNSLALMCIHEPFKRIILVIVSKVSGLEIAILRESIMASLLITLLVVVSIVPLILIINRYMPMVLGKRV